LSTKDKIKELWQNRFKFGVNFTALHGNFNVYLTGAMTIGIAVGVLESAGTGHWPLALLKVSVVTGDRHSWQVMLCGLCFGTLWYHDTDIDGCVIGPDKSKFYYTTSAINHQHQSLEEII
jgi:hypothetical protein